MSGWAAQRTVQCLGGQGRDADRAGHRAAIFPEHDLGDQPEGGELRFMVVKGGVGAKVFIGFLKRLMHGQRRPVYLIVDGHPSHRAKAVKTYVESLDGRLKLFFLPPYSPEINPDELGWNDV